MAHVGFLRSLRSEVSWVQGQVDSSPLFEHPPLLRKNLSRCVASAEGRRVLADWLRNASPRVLILLLSQVPGVDRGAMRIAAGPWGEEQNGHSIPIGHLAPPSLSLCQL